MKGKKRLLAILCTLMLLLPAISLADDSFSMATDGFSTSYTYNYDYWGDVQMTPDAYRVVDVLDSMSLGLDNLGGVRISKPQGLFVRNNDLYICDTGNNRLIQVRFEGEKYEFVRVIDTVKGAEPATFKSPYDAFVDVNDNIYVADFDNNRVIMMDKDLNYIKSFTKPVDATFDQQWDFKAKKIVVDVAGRLYALVANVNKGLVKYEADTTFTGYIGANNVKVDTFQYMWKRYVMTREQRAASESFVPTEYENIYMDEEGFIYATTTSFKAWDLKSDTAKPIRRLNGVGNDILIKNDRYAPIGDWFWVSDDGTTDGPSRLTDITVLNNDIYVALDKTRGRLFGYDSQGVMLWVFGTKGNVKGAFTRPVALEHMGYNLFVMDEIENSVTIFTPTEYGQMIYDAIDTYLVGAYDASAELWQNILKLNSNYSLAFRGIGRALLRQNKYKEAMEYFEKAHDRENYGRAFKFYRKQWVEENVWWIMLIIAALIVVPVIMGKIKKMKWEVMAHEYNKVHKSE